MNQKLKNEAVPAALELFVGFKCTRKGINEYVIHPDISHGIPDLAILKRLDEELRPRIEKMSRKLLGDYFVAVEFDRVVLILKTKAGTGKAKPRALSELLGWIAHFSSE